MSRARRPEQNLYNQRFVDVVVGRFGLAHRLHDDVNVRRFRHLVQPDRDVRGTFTITATATFDTGFTARCPGP